MQRHTFSLAFACLMLLFIPTVCRANDASTNTATSAVSVAFPPQVGDGTAFTCTVAGTGLQSATLTFLAKSITAKAVKGASGQDEITLLLPVPLDHANKSTPLDWIAVLADGATVKGTAMVHIVKRPYPVQKLTVEPKYVSPDPALKERLDRERKLMSTALNARSDSRHWNLPMARPVPGKITSLYGMRRVFNGQLKNPHKGLDFRAATGDPILAIADGMVVLTGDFYYAGKFVVVDHGLGVVSISMHMSKILAEKGHTVKRGDHIGLIGSTGRSTGPHLHLGISVLGESIDALPLINQTEEDKALYANATKNTSTAKTKNNAAKNVKNTGQKDKKGTEKKSSGKTSAKTGSSSKQTPQ